jgi:hypothetical protein
MALLERAFGPIGDGRLLLLQDLVVERSGGLRCQLLLRGFLLDQGVLRLCTSQAQQLHRGVGVRFAATLQLDYGEAHVPG